jgi:ribosomal protein S18 acetylase RimI-like enzyme
MLPGEVRAVSVLLREVFAVSLAPATSPGGAAHFWRYTSAEALRARQQAQHWALTARLPAAGPGTLVGVIEVRRPGHVCLLAVLPAWQRRGIGRQLVRQAARRCCQAQPGLTELTVSAEPAAVQAYRRLGFTVSAPGPGAEFVLMELALGPGQAHV